MTKKDTDDDAPAKRGRPRVEEPGTSVSTWLRPDDHDKLIRLAHQQDTTVSSLVRHWLRLRLR